VLIFPPNKAQRRLTEATNPSISVSIRVPRGLNNIETTTRGPPIGGTSDTGAPRTAEPGRPTRSHNCSTRTTAKRERGQTVSGSAPAEHREGVTGRLAKLLTNFTQPWGFSTFE